jgi:GLPGLI family protein
MKKLSCLVFLILCANMHIMAQSTNTKGLVTYNYIIFFDTINRTVGTETEAFLYFDAEKKQSVYVWSRKSKARSQEFVKTTDMMYIKVKNGGADPIGDIVFKDYKNDNIVERKAGTNVKIISDSFSINWQISEDTKILKDMVLQKAECDFRGRHYTAWFNPKIPIPDGPWKLRGLPGLIIEAYDEKKHVQFNFTSLTLPAEFSQKIEAPSDGTPVVYDCVKFTNDFYKGIRELIRATSGKIEQLGGTTQGGGSGITTNLIERCY